MAYGDNSQYGNFQFQFDPNFLSNIMSMAQARKQKQQQQQQQMMQSALQLANREGWLQSSRPAAPEGMSANQATLMSAANAAPSDAQKLRIMAYGPSQGEYTHDTNYGPLGALRQGDVAISPNLKARFPLGSRIVVAGQPYRVADWSYYHPGEPTSNTVEIWNGQDLGYQPVQSFAQGGVVTGLWNSMQAALNNSNAGQLGTLPAPLKQSYGLIPPAPLKPQPQPLQPFQPAGGPQAISYGTPSGFQPEPDRHRGTWRNFNNPFNVQSFARGGVASWTDPYNNEPLAAQEYTRSVPMADVSGIAGAIMRQNQAKQEMYQQNMQNAFQAANKIMQQRQTDEIGKALITNNPEISQDPRTIAMINAGAHPLDVYKAVSQQQADEADAKRQATNDYWTNLDRQRLINKDMGLDAYGSKLPADASTGPEGKVYDAEIGGYATPYQISEFRNRRLNDLQNYADQYNIPSSVTGSTTAVHSGRGGSAYKGGDVPAGQYELQMPDGSVQYVTKDYFEQSKQANRLADTYRKKVLGIAQSSNPSDNQTGTAPPVTTAKQLDAATAKQFLDQAGGDKNKARQLAQAAGYTF